MHGSRTDHGAQPRLGVKFAALLAPLLLFCSARWANSNTGEFAIRFNEHLKISSDIKLTGVHSATTFRFTCESGWKPIPGSALHLFISHSPDLDSGRSFLSVTLNYGVLRSFRLDEQNAGETELIIPLPSEMLQADNEIIVSIEQFPKPSGSNALWTSVKMSSFASIRYEESRSALDLSLLPAPLVDHRSYRPKHISVLVPEHASFQTLEATALLISNYASELDEPLSISPVFSIDAATDRLLIVGTPDEQPLRLLDSRLPFGIFRVGQKTLLGANSRNLFDQTEGIVTLGERAGPRFRPFLLVTGNSPDAVLKAAHQLVEGQVTGSNAFARISQAVRTPSALPREWRGFLPPRSHFILGQIEQEELKFDFQNGYSISIPLRATPDARFLDYGHHMTLRFRLSPNAEIGAAYVDVQLNGSRLGQYRATDFSSGSRTSIAVKIRASQLRPENVLTVTWRGLTSGSDTDAAAWLLPSTEFDLPRDFESDLPDLALLQHGLFPFSLRPDLSDIVIVVPDGSDSIVAASLFEFAARLGRLVHSGKLSYEVRRQSQFLKEARDASHVIALHVGTLPESTRSKNLLGVIEEKASSDSGNRYVLNLTAGSPAALQIAVRSIFSEDTLQRLRGDTAYVYTDRVSAFRTQRVHRMHEYSYFAHLQTWMRENWVTLPVILTTVSCLLFVGLRLALAQYKNRP